MKRLRAIFDRYTLIGLVLTLGLGWLLHAFLLGNAARFGSYDWLFRITPAPPPPKDVVVVLMDEESHVELGQPIAAPWDRRLHARLIRRLSDAGAKAIVFDIVFLTNKFVLPEEDAALITAAKDSGRVILAANPRPDPTQEVPGVDPPMRPLRRAVNERWGLVQMAPSHDQVMRLHPPSFPLFKPSLSWVAAKFLGAPVTQVTNESDIMTAMKQERWLRYYGPALTLNPCSYQDALDPARKPDSFFRDKVVFVGAATLTKFSGERKDSYVTPYSLLFDDSQQFMAGVEVQATATLNLLRGDWLSRPSKRAEGWLVIVVGVLYGAGLIHFRPRSIITIGLLSLMALLGTAMWLFMRHNFWFPWLIPASQICAAGLYAVSVNSVRLAFRNRLLLQSLSSYLSPKLALKFAGDKAQELMRPGATKHEVTVFFSDIAGFTSISERMDPDDLAHMMNQYFETAVGQCVFPTDGTVVKFIGDAIFAIWNAPDPQPDHAWRACDAALRFRQQAVQEINGRQLITRIGLHTGEANVGNFGSQKRFDYTAFGENINLAARMEGLNKYLGTLTLMTGETFRLAGDRFLTRQLGRLVLKGFEKAVEVHELVGKPEQRAEFAELHAAFAAALAEFQAGRLDAAQAAFEAVKARWPEDGPTKFYLKAIAEFREHPSDKPWTGEVELKEK